MIEEEVLNTEIGNILRSCLHSADVKVEENKQLKEGSQRPDFTVRRDSREPILIENKIGNEGELVKQCQARLRTQWNNGDKVRLVIGLLTPQKYQMLSDSSKLKPTLLKTSEMRWALWQDDLRFPTEGWFEGSLQLLAGFIDRTGANAVDLIKIIDRIKLALEQEAQELGRNQFSHVLFGQILKQEPSEQTTRMGLAIILNAVIFQAHLARTHTAIEHPLQMQTAGTINQYKVCLMWDKILEINYMPIFLLARKLLVSIKDTRLGGGMTRHLFDVVIDISNEVGSQGLIGLIFGELIKDRKLLASFYTMPQPALLLSELAVARLQVDWSDDKQLQDLRVADFAAGTGTLLVSTYKRIAERYMLAGKNPTKLHKVVMEEIMLACDVDPAAIHITAARLSGEYPNIDYSSTKIYAMPYGLTKMNGANEYRLGSLDLLKDNRAPTLFGDRTEIVMPFAKPKIPRVDRHNTINVQKESLDVIIMNPPFTRSTGHEATKKGIPNPAFAGLGTTEKEQQAMGKTLKMHLGNLKKNQVILASHGNAGLGSNFMDLAHVKLKPGGILALVLPITVISGDAWQNMRRLLARYYQDIVFVSVSAHGKYGRNWSSDTSLSEVMIVAKKLDTKQENTNQQAWYVTLDEQPQTANEAIAIAQNLDQQTKEGDLKIGNIRVGWIIKDSLVDRSGNPTGIRNSDLVILAKNLLNSNLILPRQQPLSLAMSKLADLGFTGPYHADINGWQTDKTPRGAFDITPLKDRDKYSSISYPALWNHDTKAEKRMFVTPDSQGRVRPKTRDQAVETWQGYQGSHRAIGGACRLHINRDFSTTSQSLGACLTPVASLGGSAWPSFQIKNHLENKELLEKVVCLWLNTTLGLIGRWYISSGQQPGRSRMSISTIGSIPVINVNQLTKTQIKQLAKIFDNYAQERLQSAYLLDQDKIRQNIDADVFGVLQLPATALQSLQILRQQWGEESSVRGSKK